MEPENDNRRAFEGPSNEPQHVGYFEKFPCKYTLPAQTETSRSILGECQCKSFRKLSNSFGAFYSEPTHRRLIDMINQCRYLASKQGMDKRQLIDSIKQDELKGNTYLEAFQHAPLCNSHEIPLHPNPNLGSGESTWTPTSCSSSKVKVDHEPFIENQTLNRIMSFDRMENEEQKNDHKNQCIYVSRPPTCRGPPPSSTATTGVMDKNLDNLFEGSDESDFDPSETSQLLEKMNSANVNRFRGDFEEDSCATTSDSQQILPIIRKPATHNLSIFYEYEENLEESEDETKSNANKKQGTANEEEKPEHPKKDEELNEHDDEDSKTLIVRAARAKACASYAKLKEKMNKQGNKPVFAGLFELNEQMFQSD